MQTQLLCTFSNTRKLRKTVDTIVNTYDVIYNKIFVLEDVDNTFDLMCTYNIDKTIDNSKLEQTISYTARNILIPFIRLTLSIEQSK